MIRTARQLKDLIRNLSIMRNYMMERFWNGFPCPNIETSSF